MRKYFEIPQNSDTYFSRRGKIQTSGNTNYLMITGNIFYRISNESKSKEYCTAKLDTSCDSNIIGKQSQWCADLKVISYVSGDGSNFAFIFFSL